MPEKIFIDNRSLDLYLHEINKTSLLTKQEEWALAKRIRQGDQDAVDKLVKANLRFVVSIAKQYANQGLSLEDLINDGNLGLIKAAHRFDEKRGYKFISYAVWWIRQAMLQSLAEHSRIVRLPLNRAGTLYRIGRTTCKLEQELGRPPKSKEIANRLKISEQEVEDTRQIHNTHVSLDSPYSEEQDDSALVDYLEDDQTHMPDKLALEDALCEDIKKAMETLTKREKQILTMYFGLDGEKPMTLEAIGKKMQLTRERIRQIKEKAILRLRHESRAKYIRSYIDD